MRTLTGFGFKPCCQGVAHSGNKKSCRRLSHNLRIHQNIVGIACGEIVDDRTFVAVDDTSTCSGCIRSGDGGRCDIADTHLAGNHPGRVNGFSTPHTDDDIMSTLSCDLEHPVDFVPGARAAEWFVFDFAYPFPG